jgi:hypothetical protein
MPSAIGTKGPIWCLSTEIYASSSRTPPLSTKPSEPTWHSVNGRNLNNCVAAAATLHRARRAALAGLHRDNAEYVVGVEGDGVAERVARAPT